MIALPIFFYYFCLVLLVVANFWTGWRDFVRTHGYEGQLQGSFKLFLNRLQKIESQLYLLRCVRLFYTDI